MKKSWRCKNQFEFWKKKSEYYILESYQIPLSHYLELNKILYQFRWNSCHPNNKVKNFVLLLTLDLFEFFFFHFENLWKKQIEITPDLFHVMTSNLDHEVTFSLTVSERHFQTVKYRGYFNENCSFRTYTKFSEKLTFLTPWYAPLRARIRGWKMSVFRKIFQRTKWIILWC